MNNQNHLTDILIVDDEKDICALVSDVLQDEGYSTRSVNSSIDALQAINGKLPSLVLLDIWLVGSEIDGLGVLEIINKKHPNVPVIMFSGHGNIEIAVNAIKMGASDFIEKPFKEEILIQTIANTLKNFRLRKENQKLKAWQVPDDKLIGNSGCLNNIRANIEKYAKTNSRVFIQGPRSSGKSTIAKLFYMHSDRANAAIEYIDLTNIDPDILDEIFYGSVQDTNNVITSIVKSGVFERAMGGTLVLEEVGDLPIEFQSKLLRTITANKFTKPGSDKEIKLDCRIISTSSKDIKKLVEQEEFSNDLYHRLNIVNINVLGLKDRQEDVVDLIEYYLRIYSHIHGRRAKTVSSKMMANLKNHDWQGNVTELKNFAEWLVIMDTDTDQDYYTIDVAQADIIGNKIMNINLSSGNGNESIDIMSLPLREARECFEKYYLGAQATRFDWNISKTSEFVGMERSALHRKLKSLNLTGDKKDEGLADSIANTGQELESV